MRVLVVTNMYPPHHYGGYELNCQEFVERLRAAGDDVLVLTSDIRVRDAAPGPADPGVRRELPLYWQDHVVLRPPMREALSRQRRAEATFDAAVDEHRPDVVSIWHLGALPVSLLGRCHDRGLPLVHVVNDDWLVYATTIDGWLRRWRRLGPLAALAERLLGTRCRPPAIARHGAFVFVSQAVRLAAEGAGHDFASATVGYCGVNTEHFPPGAVLPKAGWGWRLLHVGRIDARKGIDTVIAALAELPEQATLDVIGWGEDDHRRALELQARQLGLGDRVRFATCGRDELRGRYADADVVVFPPRWGEPFGLVPLEAMACATPVVATGTGGSGEFLLDGVNCLRVGPDDPAGIAAAVRRLADDPALRAQLVAGGLATAEELSLDRWLDLLVAWHRAAASGPDVAAPPAREPIDRALTRRLLPGRAAGPPDG